MPRSGPIARRCLVAVAATTTALAGCGTGASPGPSAQPTAATIPTGIPASVHVEAASAVASPIGRDGGTLSATATDGTAYSLEIPEHALRHETQVTMVPVSSVDGLALSGGLGGAVYLAPAGLELTRPAVLRITTSRAAPAGTRLIGFDVADAGAETSLAPAFAADGTMSVIVFHFSAPGVGFGTQQDVQSFTSGTSADLRAIESQLLAFPTPWDSTVANDAGALIDGVFDDFVLPALQAANDDFLLDGAVNDWRLLRFLIDLWAEDGDVADALALMATPSSPESFANVIGPGREELDRKVAAAIAGNKAVCRAEHSLGALANLYWYRDLGAELLDGFRDWQAEIDGCATLALASHNLPATLAPGVGHELELAFVIDFFDGTQVPSDFLAVVGETGLVVASPKGMTEDSDANRGRYRTLITPPGPPPPSLTIGACWFDAGGFVGLCVEIVLPIGSAPTAAPSGAPGPTGSASLPDLTGSYVISGQSVNAQRCGSLFTFNGTATVVQVGAAVTVTWTFDALTTPDADSCVQGQWAQVTKSGTFSGTLVGDMTVGFKITGIPLSCGGPVAGGASTVGLSPRPSIVIVNDCGPSVFARADRAGS